MTQPQTLDRALAAVIRNHGGIGGAAAVLKGGEVLLHHGWGWADQDRRYPFTPASLFRICSISKQFTCATLIDRFPDPSALDGDVKARLPLLAEPAPRTADLANNQSGLRDYWATAMLCGSPVEAPFGEAEAQRLIRLSRSLHFEPGTRYSYCNQNFRILGDILADRADRPLSDLLQTIFDRAGMERAILGAETSALPDGTIGYEGSLEEGFRPAVNRILWTGDAGIAASLDDMIAWEKFIDATRDDANGLYRRISTPQSFRNGAPAKYGFGISHGKMLGKRITSHGGGLRGWRSIRFYAPEERISVVVLLNHLGDPRPAAQELFAAALGVPSKGPDAVKAPGWSGTYIEPETGLVTRIETSPDNKVQLHFTGRAAEALDAKGEAEAGNDSVRLRRSADGLWMDRPDENFSSRLVPQEGEAKTDIAGSFHSPEYDATLTVVDRGGQLAGAFSGFLGPGLMQPLIPAGPDLWRLPCPRSLDYSPPGDWTIAFRREGGRIAGARAGCWPARKIEFGRA
ncbi:MAG: D-aminopeptidase [Alphaproteobacteria bacterium]|nr:D-aminopeptidase [Alphaproteobacteria bacterium]